MAKTTKERDANRLATAAKGKKLAIYEITLYQLPDRKTVVGRLPGTYTRGKALEIKADVESTLSFHNVPVTVLVGTQEENAKQSQPLLTKHPELGKSNVGIVKPEDAFKLAHAAVQAANLAVQNAEHGHEKAVERLQEASRLELQKLAELLGLPDPERASYRGV